MSIGNTRRVNVMTKEMAAARRAAGLVRVADQHACAAHRDWLRQLPLIPDDTRSLSARLLGDPLPGRSALDRRIYEASK